MTVVIKGLNIKPCKDGFDGKGLVIIGYDDKLYAVAHEQIIPLPDHGDLIDQKELMRGFADFVRASNNSDFAKVPTWNDAVSLVESAPVVIPAERSEDEVPTTEKLKDLIMAVFNMRPSTAEKCIAILDDIKAIIENEEIKRSEDKVD